MTKKNELNEEVLGKVSGGQSQEERGTEINNWIKNNEIELKARAKAKNVEREFEWFYCALSNTDYTKTIQYTTLDDIKNSIFKRFGIDCSDL